MVVLLCLFCEVQVGSDPLNRDHVDDSEVWQVLIRSPAHDGSQDGQQHSNSNGNGVANGSISLSKLPRIAKKVAPAAQTEPADVGPVRGPSHPSPVGHDRRAQRSPGKRNRDCRSSINQRSVSHEQDRRRGREQIQLTSDHNEHYKHDKQRDRLKNRSRDRDRDRNTARDRTRDKDVSRDRDKQMVRKRDREHQSSPQVRSLPHCSPRGNASSARNQSIIDLSAADAPTSLPIVSISEQAPQRYVALRRATVRRDWPRTSIEIGVVEIGELITVVEARILTDSGQQRLRLDRGGWISAATADGIALLQKVHEPQQAIKQSRSLTPPTSDDEDMGAGSCYADSELPYDPLAVPTTAAGPAAPVIDCESPTLMSSPSANAALCGSGHDKSTFEHHRQHQQRQASSAGGKASVDEMEQLRQQELSLYRQILTLSDEQVEALAPDAREQVRPTCCLDAVVSVHCRLS